MLPMHSLWLKKQLDLLGWGKAAISPKQDRLVSCLHPSTEIDVLDNSRFSVGLAIQYRSPNCARLFKPKFK